MYKRQNVYGFGEKKTPRPFVNACDKFIYTEILRKDDMSLQTEKKSIKELKGDTKLVSLLRNAVEAAADESGWAGLGGVGQNIVNQSPEFDPRNYGYKKLSELVIAIQLFEIDERSTSKSPGKAIYIRDKRKKEQ